MNERIKKTWSWIGIILGIIFITFGIYLSYYRNFFIWISIYIIGTIILLISFWKYPTEENKIIAEENHALSKI